MVLRQKIKTLFGNKMVFLSINQKHASVAIAKSFLERGKRVAVFHPSFGLKEAILNNGSVSCVALNI